jgi:NADPH:quinone reductase-like Zn-dependent oxidoreductase/pimeloyl-ACP methyl ester carboxylesterase
MPVVQPEKFYIKTSAGQIHGRRITMPGVPVVLLHRTPVSSSSHTAVMGVLAAHGIPSVALDTPGFGESFMPSGQPDARDYGRWLLEALDALELEAFHLAGHHTGTHFAAEIAALAPERTRSLTLSGVMLATEAEREKMRVDVGNAPAVDSDGAHVTETFRLMKSLFLDPVAELVHAETLGALISGHGRDLAFDAIFRQDFSALLETLLAARIPVQVVQAADDPFTLTGMLETLRSRFPQVPVTVTGPAFLAHPERQPGAFGRAISSFTKGPQDMNNRRYQLMRADTGFDLVRADADVPQPGPGEVLVRVHAVSLNRRDLSIRDLSYPVSGANAFVPLSDAAGVVVATGPGCTSAQPGQRVMSSFFQNHPGDRITLPGALSALGGGGPGVFADHVILAETGVVAMPDGWSFEEAACLPCAAVTAWNALMTLGQLRKDDHVLIIGTGGVALFAVQIAAASGAKPIILSSSNEKLARAMQLGATDGINYRTTPDWAEAVRKLTGGAGVQHVLELGGAGTLPKSIAALGLGGHLALVGALDGFGGQIDALPLIFSALRVSAVLVGSRADHQAVAAFMASHGLRPVIDRVFGFDEARAAYDHADAGAFGKVVIRMTDPA